MPYILVACGLGLYFGLCRLIWVWNFTPREKKASAISTKRAKALKKQLSEFEAKKKLEQIAAITGIFKSAPVVGLTKEKAAEIRTLITAVDRRVENDRLITVDEVYFQQLTRAGMVIAGSIAGCLITPFAVAGVLGVSYAMSTVLSSYKEEQAEISVAISNQFMGFYKRYYVQYRRPDATMPLAGIIDSYLPSATEEFAKVLTRFQSDLGRGEEYALRQFDVRFPNNMKVHKFCAIVRARTMGDSAAFDSMKSFMEELEEQMDAFFDEEQTKREALIDKVVGVYLISSFVLMMIIMLIGMAQG